MNSQKVKMEQAGKDTVPTEDYTAVTNQMTEAQNRLSALKTQAEKFGGIEINDYDDYAGTKALMADIRETEKEIFTSKVSSRICRTPAEHPGRRMLIGI
ncbi:MAG: hypothetical protein ACLR6B_09115 [Blautia sp.]